MVNSIIIFLVFLLIAWMLISIVSRKPAVIEERFTNPNRDILRPGIAPFFVRDPNARYAVKVDGENVVKENNSADLLRGGIYRPLHYEPGANNTYGDLLWNYVSPKMILMNNCMDCNKWKKDNDYNPPPGLLNDVASQYADYNAPTMLWDELPISKYPHVLSKEIDSGIMPVDMGCLENVMTDQPCPNQ